MSTTISSAEELQRAILQLEGQQQSEAQLLKEQLQYTYRQIQPANLIRTAVDEVTSACSVRSDVADTIVGLAAEYLSEAVMENPNNTKKQKLVKITSIVVAYKLYENRSIILSVIKNINKKP